MLHVGERKNAKAGRPVAAVGQVPTQGMGGGGQKKKKKKPEVLVGKVLRDGEGVGKKKADLGRERSAQGMKKTTKDSTP